MIIRFLIKYGLLALLRFIFNAFLFREIFSNAELAKEANNYIYQIGLLVLIAHNNYGKSILRKIEKDYIELGKESLLLLLLGILLAFSVLPINISSLLVCSLPFAYVSHGMIVYLETSKKYSLVVIPQVLIFLLGICILATGRVTYGDLVRLYILITIFLPSVILLLVALFTKNLPNNIRIARSIGFKDLFYTMFNIVLFSWVTIVYFLVKKLSNTELFDLLYRSSTVTVSLLMIFLISFYVPYRKRGETFNGEKLNIWINICLIPCFVLYGIWLGGEILLFSLLGIWQGLRIYLLRKVYENYLLKSRVKYTHLLLDLLLCSLLAYFS